MFFGTRDGPARILAGFEGYLQADAYGGHDGTRIGEQQMFVVYKDGVETFVTRPGFSGKTDEFGMLIPFPSPPAVRKVPEHIFHMWPSRLTRPKWSLICVGRCGVEKSARMDSGKIPAFWINKSVRN